MRGKLAKMEKCANKLQISQILRKLCDVILLNIFGVFKLYFILYAACF